MRVSWGWVDDGEVTNAPSPSPPRENLQRSLTDALSIGDSNRKGQENRCPDKIELKTQGEYLVQSSLGIL